jgi:REP element-mobilizing transposase RayT
MYIHLVFGTKFRHPYSNENVADSLHAYIAGILKHLERPAIKINSVPDHIHILFRLSKNYALAKVVE